MTEVKKFKKKTHEILLLTFWGFSRAGYQFLAHTFQIIAHVLVVFYGI